jgi:hypothetical protein
VAVVFPSSMSFCSQSLPRTRGGSRGDPCVPLPKWTRGRNVIRRIRGWGKGA